MNRQFERNHPLGLYLPADHGEDGSVQAQLLLKPASDEDSPTSRSGLLATAVGAVGVIASLVAIVQFDLNRVWTASLIAVVLVASGVSYALLRNQWPNADAQMEAAIAAAGVAIAVVLLAAQISVDDRRSKADERRAIQFNATQSASLRGASLSGADLSDINLIDKSLADATIEDSQLDDGNFQRILAGRAIFDRATGRRPDFTGAFLQLASFKDAHLVEADFRRVDLGGADLSGFICERCNFDGASLMSVTTDERTNLDGSIASRDTIWPLAGVPVGSEVYAPQATMQGLAVGEFDLDIWGYTEAELTEVASLADTDLRGADLTGVHLDRVSIDRSILTDADLSGAVFGDRPPQNVVINAGTTVDRAQLGSFVDIDERPVRLSFAARFDGLELHDVQVQDPDAIRESSFVGATITGADFTGVELRGVNFSDATLIDVRFTGAQLAGTQFPGADLTGVSAAELAAANGFDGNPTKPPVIYDEDTKWPPGFDASTTWGWIDAHGPIDLRDPAVVAAPDRAVEITPYGRYRPPVMNWILKGVDLDGPSETTAEAVTPSALENMQLRGVSLRNRNFDESKLFICEFHGVDLRGSSFRRTNVAGCNLETVILSPPDRSQSQFGFTQFRGMIYDENTRFPPGFEVPADAIKLPGSIVGQQLIGLDIGGNPIPGTDARGAVLDSATLSGVDFRGSDFSGASISKRAQASSVGLAGVPMVGADLSTSNFAAADLHGADLQRANLTGTILAGADLRGADLRGATLDGADLRGAKLHGALIDDGALAAAIVDSTTTL